MASTNYYMETPEGRIGYGLPQPYDPSRQYTLRDCVTWQGSSYIVLTDVKGVTPSDDRQHYAMLAQRGAEGASNARIFVGAAVTGNGSAVVEGSAAGDVYINSETGDLYQATDTDVWAWKMNLLTSTAKGHVVAFNWLYSISQAQFREIATLKEQMATLSAQ